MKRIILSSLLFLFCLSPITGLSQTKSISGTVIDGSTKQPLVGASIVGVGSQSGTLSDYNGKFNLVVSTSTATIEVSYIGYVTQNVAATNNLTISLEPDVEAIDDIVIIGYGAVRKSDLTGSVASIDSDDLMVSTPQNLQKGMQGRIAGVNITANDGAPGAGISVQIRGTNSFLGDTEPLYVIDGVPITTSSSQETISLDSDNITSNNPLSFLNPSDIASMEILKDASSTAIYGSRGSNGVVLITTKSGQTGQAKIDVLYNFSVSSVSKKIEMLSSQEYAEMTNLREIMTTLIDGGTTVNLSNLTYSGVEYSDGTSKYSPSDYPDDNRTYWQDEIMRTAISHEFGVNISGGNKDLDYAISGGYLDQEGVIINSDFTRYSLKVNLNSQVKPWLKIGTSTNLSYTFSNTLKNTTNSTNNGNEGVVRSALYYPATYGIFDEAAEAEGEYTMVANPDDYANALNENKNYNIYTSNYLQANLAKGLIFKTTLGYNASLNYANQYYGTDLWEGREPTNGKSSAGDNSWASLVYDNLLMYNQDFGLHNVSGTLGTSWEESSWYNKQVTVEGFGSDLTEGWLLGDAAYMTDVSSSKGESQLFSLIFRAAYNYDHRYYLTFTARRDSSSKFAEGNRSAFFPSAGVSWRASQEKFMQPIDDIVSNLKLRYSYGTSGNQAISSYATFANMTSANYPFGSSVINGYATDPDNPGNADLTWETTYQHDIGIDLQLFNRIDLTVDAYHKMTCDLLQQKQVATSTGLSQILSNFGQVMNKGLEITLNANIINKKDFTWSAGGNISFNENEIVELGTESQYPNTLWNSYRPFILAEGRPIGQLVGFIEDGIWQNREEVIQSEQFQAVYPGYTVSSNDSATETIINQKYIGEIKYKDLDGDNVITDNDMDYIGDVNPDFYYGFNTSFTYKNFDFNMLFQGVYGNDILNQTLMRFHNSGGTRNMPVALANEIWSPQNPDGTLPKLYTTYSRTIRMSSRYLEDGSYLKLRTVSLGYTLNNPFDGIRRLRLSLSGNNLFTITDYSGYDPEVNSFGSNATTRGIDGGGYPQSRTFIFGVNLTL